MIDDKLEEISTVLQLITAIRLGGDPKNCHISIGDEERLVVVLYDVVKDLVELAQRNAVSALENASDQSEDES